MKAIRIPRHGGPHVQSYDDVVLGVPGPGESLVEKRAIGVNVTEACTRSVQGR